MFQEIEVSEIIIVEYNLKVIDKDKDKVLLNRFITDKDLSIKLFHEAVNLYHNKDGRYKITLYDINKCTNIESYDTDDNI